MNETIPMPDLGKWSVVIEGEMPPENYVAVLLGAAGHLAHLLRTIPGSHADGASIVLRVGETSFCVRLEPKEKARGEVLWRSPSKKGKESK